MDMMMIIIIYIQELDQVPIVKKSMFQKACTLINNVHILYMVVAFIHAAQPHPFTSHTPIHLDTNNCIVFIYFRSIE